MPKTADLLEEIAALKALLIAADARDKRKDERIERLEKLVAAFKQAAFGRRSEKSDPDQFELALEDLETAMAVVHAEEDAEDRAAKRPAKPRAANRGSLPKHLPRIEEIIEPDRCSCFQRVIRRSVLVVQRPFTGQVWQPLIQYRRTCRPPSSRV